MARYGLALVVRPDLLTDIVLQSDESRDAFESLLSKEEQELQTSDNMSIFIRGNHKT